MSIKLVPVGVSGWGIWRRETRGHRYHTADDRHGMWHMAWHVMACYGMLWHVMTWHVMSWHDMAWLNVTCHCTAVWYGYGKAWHGGMDMARHGMVVWIWHGVRWCTGAVFFSCSSLLVSLHFFFHFLPLSRLFRRNSESGSLY